MDRPEPGLVKWSPNSTVDSFIHINLQHRVVQLYEPTGHARKGRLDYEKLSRHDDFPPLTTYDWSPTNNGLLAVGTASGVINLLRIDDGSNAFIELGLKVSRTCQAVSFNTTGLLAVGLDRVRMDQSLHIWDVNRLGSLGKDQAKGLPQDLSAMGLNEPKHRLEPSVSVSSIKFFEDSPQTLVLGIRGQGLRIHDLRDPSSLATFQTKCNNNLTIDYADQNFFASSALDHPGVMIWDRRATSRPVASLNYLQAVDQDDLPWGGALRLDKVVETETDPVLAEGKHSLIRSLRYCRDHRGLLAVLSRTGQLRVLETTRETPTGDNDNAASTGPELMQVRKSHELDVSYADSSRRNNSIVSFDWVTLGSPSLRPRLLVLRANGGFEILEQPSQASDYIYKFVPWQAPHRGLEEGSPYMNLMQFEAQQASEILGPVLAEQALADIPIFGPDPENLRDTIEAALHPLAAQTMAADAVDGSSSALPRSFYEADGVAGKLEALRAFVREQRAASDKIDTLQNQFQDLKAIQSGPDEVSLASNVQGTCREIHDALLSTLVDTHHLPSEAQCVVDHSMILRAKEKYLFDAATNRKIVSDDPWTMFAWDWIADAENAADDGGMVMGNMDLSYLGINSIWLNDLGRTPSLRLEPGTSMPDASYWERSIGQYCKKRYLPKFDGVSTKRPHHRQLLLEICGWGDMQTHDTQSGAYVNPEQPVTEHTMAASRALFRGDTKQAIHILKKASASHHELLFVSLALQLVDKGGEHLEKEQLDIDDVVASRTDPYLQAISSLIATGNWTSIANQQSLPLSDRAFVAVRNFSDDQLTAWLQEQTSRAVAEGDIEGIVLTGITDTLVDVLARYVERHHDVQTATLILSICAPRYIDDVRCVAWRRAYRAHLQRHKLFFHRTRFDVESTRRSKRAGVPTLKPPSRQIALRCVYCDAQTNLANNAAQGESSSAASSSSATTPSASALASVSAATAAMETRNPLLSASVNAGISCPNCGRHLPRCVVCLEVVGVPRSDNSHDVAGSREDGDVNSNSSNSNGNNGNKAAAGRFPTFCLRCDHVLHLDHARMWFARHSECPVPECRCRCNFRANPELSYH